MRLPRSLLAVAVTVTVNVAVTLVAAAPGSARADESASSTTVVRGGHRTTFYRVHRAVEIKVRAPQPQAVYVLEPSHPGYEPTDPAARLSPRVDEPTRRAPF